VRVWRSPKSSSAINAQAARLLALEVPNALQLLAEEVIKGCEGRLKNETPPPKLSPSCSGCCRAANDPTHRVGASLSVAARALPRWVCTWWWDGHLCAPGGPNVARATRSAFCHRESGGSLQQYRHRGSHTCPGGRLHASWYRFRRGNQCCPVRQPQLQLHPRYGLSRREPRPPCRGGAPIPSRQNHSGVHYLRQSEPRQDRAGVVGHRWYQPYGWRTL